MSKRLYVATRKGLFFLEKGANGWSVSRRNFLGNPIPMTFHDPHDGSLYATMAHGHFGVKMYRSSDDGETWDSIPCPAYPEAPEGEDKAGWSLELIWAMESAGEAGSLWAGTIPGGLFKTTDRGDSWSLNEPLWQMPERNEWFGGGYDSPGIHSICVDPRDPQRILVGVSCGGCWLTEDGGSTWAVRAQGMFAEFMPPERKYDPNIQDPHRVVRCGSAPDVLYAQHHNGVFKSEDDGANWTELEGVPPSVFGFATQVHPGDPNTAWFVPAVKDECRIPVDGQVVVSRTRDGGSNWDILRAGLPQEDAYDLVYRHGLAVDDSGDVLALGSTSGGLWISEDQGDHWSTISTHLPPVFAVRFAP